MRKKAYMLASLTRSNQAQTIMFQADLARCSLFSGLWVRVVGKTRIIKASTSLSLNDVFANAWNSILAVTIGSSEDRKWTRGFISNYK